MDTYRQPQASKMLFALTSTGQSYPQTNTWSLLGTHKVNGIELRAMHRGDVQQGIENSTATNLVACTRLKSNGTAFRLRPYLICSADPSAVSLKLGIGLYPKFPGDNLSGNSQGVSPASISDTARTAGTCGEITLVGKATSLGNFSVNPLTGEDWPTGISVGSHAVHPVVGATLTTGAFGRLLSLEGFSTGNPDAGFILIDPAFNEYLIVKLTANADATKILGLLLAIDSDC